MGFTVRIITTVAFGTLLTLVFVDTLTADEPPARTATSEQNEAGNRSPPPFRTWTDLKGRTIEAQFVEFEDRKVRIKKRNAAKPDLVDLDRLCDVDRQYLAGVAEEIFFEKLGVAGFRNRLDEGSSITQPLRKALVDETGFSELCVTTNGVYEAVCWLWTPATRVSIDNIQGRCGPPTSSKKDKFFVPETLTLLGRTMLQERLGTISFYGRGGYFTQDDATVSTLFLCRERYLSRLAGKREAVGKPPDVRPDDKASPTSEPADAERDKTAKEFTGDFQRGVLAFIGDAFQKVAIFRDRTRASLIEADTDKISDAILRDICTNGDALKSIPGFAREMNDHVNKLPHALHIAVFMLPSIPLTEHWARFEAGRIKRIDDVVNKYGKAPENERWILKEFTAWVGLNGTVHWWGAVGIAAAEDGTITHILIREEEPLTEGAKSNSPSDSARKEEPSNTPPLPAFKKELSGPREVRIQNPNSIAVTAGLRSGDGGKNFMVKPNGTASVYVPDGKYDIYFVYADEPEALFQGDSFSLSGNGVEIQLVKIVDGNYGIRRVK